LTNRLVDESIQDGDNVSKRERYPSGVPCWVETLQPNPEAALDFYGSLFRWEFVGPGVTPGAVPGDPPGQYFVARVKGLDVAGIGSQLNRTDAPAPTWTTYIRVASADRTVEKVQYAGGTVRAGPLDAMPAGRLAVLTDPAGAEIRIWEAGGCEGAQLINEPRAWAISELHTTDPESSKEFYGALFGWQPEQHGPAGAQITLWRLPGYVGGEPEQPVPRDVIGLMMPIGGGGARSAQQPHWSVEFWVDDVNAISEHAAMLGGRVSVPPYDTSRFRNAVLVDPQGAAFSVSKLVPKRGH